MKPAPSEAGCDYRLIASLVRTQKIIIRQRVFLQIVGNLIAQGLDMFRRDALGVEPVGRCI